MRFNTFKWKQIFPFCIAIFCFLNSFLYSQEDLSFSYKTTERWEYSISSDLDVGTIQNIVYTKASPRKAF